MRHLFIAALGITAFASAASAVSLPPLPKPPTVSAPAKPSVAPPTMPSAAAYLAARRK